MVAGTMWSPIRRTTGCLSRGRTGSWWWTRTAGNCLGEVTGIQGAHGTAIVESAGRGFATSGNDQSVVVFDLKTFRTLGRIPAAEDADAIIYDPPSNRVFTFNGDAQSSTVIDPKQDKQVTNIPLGGKPEYGASA